MTRDQNTCLNTFGRFEIITVIFVEIDYLGIFDRRVASFLNNLARESRLS